MPPASGAGEPPLSASLPVHRADLEGGRLGWLACLVGVLVAAIPTLDWHVPDWQGVAYPLALWAISAAVVLGVVITRRARGGRSAPWIGPVEVLAIVTATACGLGVLTLLPTQPLRDLGVYLRAGEAFRDGGTVYLDHLVTEVPVDRTTYPFLYPPLLLPPLAVLASLPRPLVEIGWLCGSAAAMLAGLRALGLPWRWAIAALAWRPIAEGIYVGNVAIPLFACLALAPRWPSLLVLPPIAKAYSATATLWLVRERRWGSLVRGVILVAALVLAALPLTGLDRWLQWVAGLDWFARSQPLLPDYLYGIALPRYLGELPALAVGLLVLALALLVRGREGLARLGLATPAISPSAFAHGLTAAIPSMLSLRPAVLWICLGAMGFGGSAGAWLGPALAVGAWVLPILRRAPEDGRRAGIPDPLGGAAGPWPDVPEPEASG